MINKMYEKVLCYIKDNFSFLLLMVFILVCFRIDTGYTIYKPGGSINITDRIHSNRDITPTDGSLNMAYVGMIKGKLPFYLLAKIMPGWDLVQNHQITYNDDETMEDSLKRDRLYYEESISSAKYLAYLKSGVPFTIKKETNYIIYVSKECTGDVLIGDEILTYDGISYTTINALKEYINNKDVNDEITLVVKRDGKEVQTKARIYLEEATKLIGLAATTIYDLESEVNLTIDSKATESGPSGGLMLTLAIYNALIDEDITKGKKIIGTGTINIDGEVGEIGGVNYKLAGAVKNKADLFIVPEANYEEAIKYAKEKDYDIIIEGIASFDEALEVLTRIK